MNWKDYSIDSSGSFHLNSGEPVYSERFDEVLKYHAPGLAPVLKAGEAWHINHTGNAAYTSRFSRTFGFYEGMASVCLGQNWFHIYPDGNRVYSENYEWCGNFQNERCTVRNFEGEYFHLSPTGIPAYSSRWKYAGDFLDGVAVVQLMSGKSTHIDLRGLRVHSNEYLDLDVFHKGYARARDSVGWMHVDINGRSVYEERFANVEPFYNGQARVERMDGGLEVIDEKGKVLVELRAGLKSDFSELSSDLVGFWKTETIAAAVKLNVFDNLPGTVNVLALLCEANAQVLERLMNALGELKLVEVMNGEWKATSRGEYLTENHPFTLKGAAFEYSDHFVKAWKELGRKLKVTSDWIAPEVFKDVAKDELRIDRHHQMLNSYAAYDYGEVARLIQLKEGDKVIDAGGGFGYLTLELAKAFPKSKVNLLELPEVGERFLKRKDVPANVSVIKCDIFESWSYKVDVVVLARVLHDWSDDKALGILKRAREALSVGGVVYIVEMVLEESGFGGHLCDLHLLMCTGGQERTEGEFKGLLEMAGFEFVGRRELETVPSVLIGRVI